MTADISSDCATAHPLPKYALNLPLRHPMKVECVAHPIPKDSSSLPLCLSFSYERRRARTQFNAFKESAELALRLFPWVAPQIMADFFATFNLKYLRPYTNFLVYRISMNFVALRMNHHGCEIWTAVLLKSRTAVSFMIQYLKEAQEIKEALGRMGIQLFGEASSSLWRGPTLY